MKLFSKMLLFNYLFLAVSQNVHDLTFVWVRKCLHWLQQVSWKSLKIKYIQCVQNFTSTWHNFYTQIVSKVLSFWVFALTPEMLPNLAFLRIVRLSVFRHMTVSREYWPRPPWWQVPWPCWHVSQPSPNCHVISVPDAEHVSEIKLQGTNCKAQMK